MCTKGCLATVQPVGGKNRKIPKSVASGIIPTSQFSLSKVPFIVGDLEPHLMVLWAYMSLQPKQHLDRSAIFALLTVVLNTLTDTCVTFIAVGLVYAWHAGDVA